MVCCCGGDSRKEREQEEWEKKELEIQKQKTLEMEIEKQSSENHQLKEQIRRMEDQGKRSRKRGQPFEFVRKIKIHDAPVHSVAIHPNKEEIATGSWDGEVKIYNIENDEVIQTLGDSDRGQVGKMGGIYSVCFAHSAANVLGCTSCDSSVYLWDTLNGNMRTKLSHHKGDVNDLDFHPKQHVMCTVSDDATAIIWDIQEGIVLREIEAHTDHSVNPPPPVYGTTFMGEDNNYLVATCSYDRTARIHDMRSKEVVQTLEHSYHVLGIDFAPAKKKLVTGSDDGLICIWDQNNWQKLAVINTVQEGGIIEKDTGIKKNRVKRVCISPDEIHVAAACSARRVLVYDIDSNPVHQYAKLKAEKGTDNGHTDAVFGIAWGGVCRERTLVSASHDHTCVYWRERPCTPRDNPRRS